MRYLSVCSGIEAATSAWHHLGWEPVAFSEIEPFPSAVLKHHYPNVPNWGDMTKYQTWPDAAIDLLVGGTPCQSFSIAGLRKGLEDPRGNLMLTFLGIADRYRPRYIVWENVPGVLSSNGGRDFGTFLAALGELGYGWAYRVLDAQWFGVAQRRRRVFVVACLGDQRRAAAVLFESESVSRHPAPSRKARKGTAPGAASGIGAGGWPAEVTPTLNACFGSKQGQENQHINGGAGLFVPVAFDAFNQADTFDLSKTVASRNDQDTCSLVSGCWWNGEDIAGTLTKMNANGAQRMPDKDNLGAVLMRQREGKDGGGNGPLISEEKSLTLATSNDQVLAQPLYYESHPQDSRVKGPKDVADTVSATYGLGGGNTPLVQQPVTTSNDQVLAFRDPSPTITSKMQGASGWAPYNEDAHLVGVQPTSNDQVLAQPVAFDTYNQTINQHTSQTLGSSASDVNHYGAVLQPVAIDTYNQTVTGDTTQTLCSRGDTPGGNAHLVPAVQTAMQVRRLTPVECERLQGFPDNFTRIPWKKKPAEECPDGPRYKALGNSMAVPCMKWIGERISRQAC